MIAGQASLRHLSVMLLLAAVVLLTACSAARPSNDKDEANPFVVAAKRAISDEDLAYYSAGMQAIYKRGKLRVAMPSTDRKPFFYVNDKGEPTGSDVELAADIAAELGVEVEYVRSATSFEGVVNQVASGQADMAVSKLSATLPRAGKVLFSNPYITLHQGLLLNRLAMARLGSGGEDPLKLLQQKGVKIGVIAGTSYVSYASQLFPHAQIVQFPTPQEAMDADLKDEVSAIYYDELQLKQFIASHPEGSIDLQLHIMRDRVDLIAIAVPPNDTQMLAWTNLYLQSNQARIDSLMIKHEIKSMITS